MVTAWGALQELKDFLAYEELSHEGKEEFDQLMEKYHDAVVAEAYGISMGAASED